MNTISEPCFTNRKLLLNRFHHWSIVALPTVFVAYFIFFCGSTWAAQLVPTALDLAGLRPAMPGEGLLAHVINPYAQNANAPARSGEEFTGWIDVRHPALSGPGDIIYGYDWYDR